MGQTLQEEKEWNDYWYLKRSYRIDVNLLHQFFWKKADANGEVRISLRKIAAGLGCGEEYFCRDLIPRMERHGRIVRWSFNEKGSLLSVTDPAIWVDPVIPKPRKPRSAAPVSEAYQEHRRRIQKARLERAKMKDPKPAYAVNPKKRKPVSRDPEAVLDSWA